METQAIRRELAPSAPRQAEAARRNGSSAPKSQEYPNLRPTVADFPPTIAREPANDLQPTNLRDRLAAFGKTSFGTATGSVSGSTALVLILTIPVALILAAVAIWGIFIALG